MKPRYDFLIYPDIYPDIDWKYFEFESIAEKIKFKKRYNLEHPVIVEKEVLKAIREYFDEFR